MRSKNLVIIMLLSLGYLFSNAQEIRKGNKLINLGLGLGPFHYSNHYKTVTPPVSASFEYIVKDDLFNGKGALGVGAFIGNSVRKSEFYRTSSTYAGAYLHNKGANINSNTDTYGWKYGTTFIGPRGYIHYKPINKLDTYGGIIIGYMLQTNKYFGDPFYGINNQTSYPNYYPESIKKIHGTVFLGARYFFTEKIAGMIELGSGISRLTLGVSVKL